MSDNGNGILLINKKLCPAGLKNNPNKALMAIRAVVIHTTANRAPTATAKSHATYQFNGSEGREASWHYTVDDTEIWQSFNDNQMTWHCGNAEGNETTIGIEICVNAGAEKFKAACKLAAKLTAELVRKYKGKRTAGVDGFKALKPAERLALFHQMVNMDVWRHKPKPAYRTYIKKKSGKLRPLGIPTIKDRVYQNVVKMALEPQWEARFEPSSYGFRPKRSCHDAMGRIFNNLCGERKKGWIFEGDFKACFDTLNHDWILKQIEGFPECGVIAKWLKAGFVDNKVFSGTEEGTPQGGIISPLYCTSWYGRRVGNKIYAR